MIDTTGYDTSEIKERIERHNTQITKEILQSYPINYFHLNTGIYYLKDINIPAEEIIAAVTMPLFWEANSIIFVVESIAHTFSRIDFHAKHYTLI